MGKRTIGAMAVICLVLSGISCSSPVVIDNYTVSSDHDIMQAFAGKGGDVYVTVRSKDPEVEGYSTLRIGESGEPIWRFKSSTIPELQNGVFCSQYKDVAELFDPVTGKLLSKIDGILIEKEFDGKSLFFQTKDKNVKLIKTDLQGKVLWEVGLGDVEISNIVLSDDKLVFNSINSGYSISMHSSDYLSEDSDNKEPKNTSYTFMKLDNSKHDLPTVVAVNMLDYETGKLTKKFPVQCREEIKIDYTENKKYELLDNNDKTILLDMSSLEPLWEKESGNMDYYNTNNSATYMLSREYDDDGDEVLMMYNLKTGEKLWKNKIIKGSSGRVGVFGDYSIVESHVNPLPVKVVAFNNADGRILWEKPLSITSSYRNTGSNLMTSKLQKAEKDYLVLSDFGSKQEKILLVDPRSGKEEFSFFLPKKDGNIKDICVSDGKVCVVYYNGAVLYNLKSGFKVAQVKYLEGTTSAGVTNLFAEFGPYVKNGLIIIKSPDGLVAYDMMTLRQLLNTVGTGLHRYVFGNNSLILWSYGAVKTASLAR